MFYFASVFVLVLYPDGGTKMQTDKNERNDVNESNKKQTEVKESKRKWKEANRCERNQTKEKEAN